MRSPRFLNIFAAAAGLAALSRRFGAGTYATRKRAFFVSVWALYCYFRVRERARIHFQRTSWNRMLVEKAMLARRRFSPVPWAFNRHAQSITCFILSMMQWAWQQPPRIERETIAGPDGNPQHLEWLLPVFDPDGDEEEEEEPPPPLDDESDDDGGSSGEACGRTPRGQPHALRRNRSRSHSFSRPKRSRGSSSRGSSSSGSGLACFSSCATLPWRPPRRELAAGRRAPRGSGSAQAERAASASWTAAPTPRAPPPSSGTSPGTRRPSPPSASRSGPSAATARSRGWRATTARRSIPAWPRA